MGILDSVKLISQPTPKKYGTVNAESYFTSFSDFSKCIWYRSKCSKPGCCVRRLRHHSPIPPLLQWSCRCLQPYKPHWDCRDRFCDNWFVTWRSEVLPSFISV